MSHPKGLGILVHASGDAAASMTRKTYLKTGFSNTTTGSTTLPASSTGLEMLRVAIILEMRSHRDESTSVLPGHCLDMNEGGQDLKRHPSDFQRTDLRPKPNTKFLGSRFRLVSASTFSKNRSGLNVSGSGYSCSLRHMALNFKLKR